MSGMPTFERTAREISRRHHAILLIGKENVEVLDTRGLRVVPVDHADLLYHADEIEALGIDASEELRLIRLEAGTCVPAAEAREIAAQIREPLRRQLENLVEDNDSTILRAGGADDDLPHEFIDGLAKRLSDAVGPICRDSVERIAVDLLLNPRSDLRHGLAVVFEDLLEKHDE